MWLSSIINTFVNVLAPKLIATFHYNSIVKNNRSADGGKAVSLAAASAEVGEALLTWRGVSWLLLTAEEVARKMRRLFLGVG